MVALHGHNPQEKIVAVHQAGDSLMRLYVRNGDGVASESVEFFPFFFLSDSSFLKGFPAKHWIKGLEGTNFFRNLCAFERWSDMWEAVRHILELYNSSAGKKALNFTELPLIHLRADPVAQYLMECGRTLFKGMEFRDLYRLQLDIETFTKHPGQLSDPSRIEDRIIIIALSDNRGWELILDGRKRTEKEMLVQLVDIIREKDPDVIEGHNIDNFDLPYIIRRCEISGVELKIGRDGSIPRLPYANHGGRQSKSPDPFARLAESGAGQTSYEIPGRHVIDTLPLLQSYDASKRSMESHGLKYAAKYFGFARPERVYIKGDQISWYWENEPDVLIRYASDDVHETRQLSDLLSPSAFYLTQMVPLDYGTVARSGSAAKIESLLLRDYVQQKHSIPTPQVGSQRTGGYTDIFYTGILGPIIYADVESLYPSIIIAENIAPSTDTLKVFPSLLKKLTEMRLQAKTSMNTSTSPQEKSFFDALQSSYKILINSFYGYLGYARGLFNDYDQASNVTLQGQRILRMLMEEIRRRDGKVIEVDTDGIFFSGPPELQTEADDEEFLSRIARVLPEKIKLAMGGRYRRMLSYKKKNYALLGYDDRITIKGSSLVARSMERFGRTYVQQCVECLLRGSILDLHTLYANLHKQIMERRVDIADLARTESLRDSKEQYEREVNSGKRNRTASYEVAISSGLHWKRGKKVSFYITGNDAEVVGFKNCKLVEHWDPNFPDENVPYYVKRLDEFSNKFAEFFLPQDFRAIFSVGDLFDFSPQGIGIVTSQVSRQESVVREEVKTPIELSIWLDTG